MGRDQAFLSAAFHTRRQLGVPHCHDFQDIERFPCGCDVRLVAHMVEGEQDCIGKAPFTMTAPGPEGLLLCHRTASAIVAASSPHAISPAWPGALDDTGLKKRGSAIGVSMRADIRCVNGQASCRLPRSRH